MAQKSLLAVLTSVTQAPETGPDTYVNEGPLIQHPFGDTAFGGSVISQAISAATATVAAGFDVYSSQSSFLRPVKANAKVSYRADRAASGRTFATRVVQATQGGRGPCYVAIISFQKRGPAKDQDGTLRYADPPPDLGLHPHDVPKLDFQQMGFQVREEELEDLSKLGVDTKEPFEWRLLPFKSARDPSQVRTYGFVRCPLPTASGVTHLASMGFLSDQSLLELSILTDWESADEGIRNLAMSTTLNSHISIHDPEARGAAWLVCEGRTSWGAGGRVATNQRFWDLETGALIMSCTQDAVIGGQQPQL